jgi:hypothetical protein
MRFEPNSGEEIELTSVRLAKIATLDTKRLRIPEGLTPAQPCPLHNALRVPQDGPVDHAALEAEDARLRFRCGEKCPSRRDLLDRWRIAFAHNGNLRGMNAGRRREPERGSIPRLSTETLKVCDVEMHRIDHGL